MIAYAALSLNISPVFLVHKEGDLIQFLYSVFIPMYK